MNYTEKAQKLLNTGFWVAGLGHFDITVEELAIILELVELEDFEKLTKMYQDLSEERL